VLAAFPLFCGAVLEHFVEMLHIDGIEAIRHGAWITMLAHLYRSVHVHFQKIHAWDDMEHFISLQGKEGLGFGQETVDCFELFQQFCRATGLCNKEVKAMQRQKKKTMSRPDCYKFTSWDRCARPRLIIELLQIESKELKTHQALGFAPGYIGRRVLTQLAQALLDDEDTRSYMAPEIVVQWDRSRKLTPVQLLDILVAHLNHKEVNLNLNYHQFTTYSWRLLAEVFEECSATTQSSSTASVISASRRHLVWSTTSCSKCLCGNLREERSSRRV